MPGIQLSGGTWMDGYTIVHYEWISNSIKAFTASLQVYLHHRTGLSQSFFPFSSVTLFPVLFPFLLGPDTDPDLDLPFLGLFLTHDGGAQRVPRLWIYTYTSFSTELLNMWKRAITCCVDVWVCTGANIPGVRFRVFLASTRGTEYIKQAQTCEKGTRYQLTHRLTLFENYKNNVSTTIKWHGHLCSVLDVQKSCSLEVV